VVSVAHKDTTVSVTVLDHGTGIAEAQLPHIFERFYRGDPARGGGTGHGLGLALASSIARAHGAKIDVKSIEGQGAEFRVDFEARAAGQPSGNLQLADVPSDER
jgi:signal transduction histidine kinase